MAFPAPTLGVKVAPVDEGESTAWEWREDGRSRWIPASAFDLPV